MQSLSVETLAISCMSMTEPPSAVLVLQRISNARDVSGICDASVGSGLLVAVYVEPFVAGQLGERVVGVGVIVEVWPDWVMVMGGVLVSVTVMGALLASLGALVDGEL